MIAVLVVVVFALSAAAYGAALLRIIVGPALLTESTPTSRFVGAFVLGQAVLSQIVLLFGLALPLGRPLLGALVAAGFLVGGRDMVTWGRAFLRDCSAAIHVLRTSPRTYVALTLVLAVFAVFLALAAYYYPPTGDAEAFYLAYPKFLAAGGRIMPFRGLYEANSSIGLQGELNFAALMMLGGWHAAKLFVWVVAVAVLLLLVVIGILAGLGTWGRLVLIAMAMTSSTLFFYVYDGKVDLFAAALGLCAVYWALVRGESSSRLSRVAGVATGLACVAKFSYIPTLGPAVLILVLWRSRRKPFGELVAEAAQFGAFALIAVVPHLIKNGVFYGEPLAPFITSHKSLSWLESNKVWYDAAATRWILSTYPFALVFGQYPMQGGGLSCLWLLFLPWVLLVGRGGIRRDDALVRLAAAGSLGLVIWLIARPSVLAPRYILAPLLLLLIPAAVAADRLHSSGHIPRFARAAGSAAVFMVVLGTLYVTIGHPREFYRSARGSQPACFRASVYCDALQSVNAAASPRERVFLGGYYSYWLRADLMRCRDTFDEDRSLFERTAPDSIWSTLYGRGFTYVLLDTTVYAKREEELDRAPRPDWLHVEVVRTPPPVVMYRLVSPDSAHRRAVSCEPAHSFGG